MDERTERLARACVEMGLVRDLSGARVREEIVALLEDVNPGKGILRLAELGAAVAIDPALAADEDTVALLDRLRALAAELAPEVPVWRLGLAALARRLAADETYALTARLRIRRRDADAVAAAVTVAPRLVRALRGREVTPAEVVALVEAYPPDAALLALALEEVPALRAYLASWREVRLAIGGGDLAALGLAESPRVGEVLAELRRRKLNGELDGREAELAAARELIAAHAADGDPPGDAATVEA
jgi:tRNA nucleotidyltransferase/poly(A) polymerase